MFLGLSSGLGRILTQSTVDEDDGSRFIYHEYTNSLKLEICRENRDQLLLFNFKQKERAVGAGIPLTALDEAEKSLKTDKPKKVIKTTKICISFRSRLGIELYCDVILSILIFL